MIKIQFTSIDSKVMSYDTNESNDYRSVLCVLGDLIDCLTIRFLSIPIYFYSDLFIPIYFH